MASDDQEKHLPALAPGPRGPIANPGLPVAKNRKNSTACLPCKQAKRKCTGRPVPCKACQNSESDCIFDETLDLRRKVAARRTLGELEHYRSLLSTLLDSIRLADDQKVQDIIRSIRNGTFLENAPPVPETSGADSDTNSEDAITQNERLSAEVHSRITLEKLCDIPLFQVPAKPWTKIANDDHLVSHLISLYFTWDHPLSQIIDQRTFLEHMSMRDTSSEFCSPLLVNSVLAVASAHSEFPDVFATPGDLSSKGRRFYLEAEKLWKDEGGRASLTNIQALALMSVSLRFQAKDGESWLMLRQAVQLAQDFGMFQTPRSRHREWNKRSTDLQYAGTITAWGIYTLNSQMSMEFREVANLSPPIARPSSLGKLNEDIVWTPYPRSNHLEYPRRPAFLHAIMAQTADLTEISVEVQEYLFDKAFDMDIGDLWIAASMLYSRLEAWFEKLPDEMKMSDEQVPQVIFLHIKYHYTTILLFDFCLNHQDSGLPSHSSKIEQARLVQFESAKRIGQCLHVQHKAFGLRHIPRQMIEPTLSSALVMLVALDHDGLRDFFVEACRFLVAFGKKFPRARDMLQRLESTAGQWEIQLPAEAGVILDHRDLESSEWL